MEHWQIEAEKAKAKQHLKKWYPEIGKIVRFSGEPGVVVFSPGWKIEDEDPEYFKREPGDYYTDAYAVRWDTNKEFDFEQYGFLDYEYLDSYEFKYINPDGSWPKTK